jgi:hypothetical protein
MFTHAASFFSKIAAARTRASSILEAVTKTKRGVNGMRPFSGKVPGGASAKQSRHRDKRLVVVACVPGLLGIPLDDQALRVTLAVVRIDIKLAVVSS